MPTSDKDKLIEELQEEILALKTIIGAMPGNVYWKSIEGHYLGCNQNMDSIIQFVSSTDLRNKNERELMEANLANIIQQIDLSILKSNEEQSIEEPGLDLEGRPAIYLTKKKPFYDAEGNIKGILGISFDITERKKMEASLAAAKQKAEAANRAKSRFLAIVSHELRTPLTSIIGFANLLAESQLSPEKQQEYVQHIINSGGYLLSLVNDVLDYSRLETRNMVLAPTPINLKKLINETVTMLNVANQLKGTLLQVNYAANAPEYIIADSRALRQIFINLISNSIKFTNQGRITIHVNVLKVQNNTVNLKIAVEDTGIGIPIEEQPHIFNKFYQIGDTYTRHANFTGTGLGLAIVKKLVKLMKGNIRVKSTLGVGSIFYFTLSFPLAEKNELEMPLPEETKKSISLDRKSPLQVLLIEDNPLIQLIHQHMLEKLHCQVDIAENATTALRMLKKEYDILFVDIGLPDIDGFELIKIMKNSIYVKKTTPIIALTGYSEEEEIQRCLSAGANEVAIKPISDEYLEKLLERYVS